jgi:hypothetical protein
MSRKETFRTPTERREADRQRVFHRRQIGASVLALTVVAAGVFGIHEAKRGGDTKFAAPIASGTYNEDESVTFSAGATLRTSAERTTDPLDNVSSANALPTLTGNETVRIDNPIKLTSPNGDQWVAGAINGNPEQTVYADMTQMAAQQELAGDNGNLFFNEIVSDQHNGTGTFKYEDHRYQAPNANQTVGYAVEQNVHL